MAGAEELEAALLENQRLKQRSAHGERLKSQHEALLEALRGARGDLEAALAQKAQIEAALGSAQQRERAMAARQAVARETEHRMAAR